jgi:hypothetical protein
MLSTGTSKSITKSEPVNSERWKRQKKCITDPLTKSSVPAGPLDLHGHAHPPCDRNHVSSYRQSEGTSEIRQTQKNIWDQKSWSSPAIAIEPSFVAGKEDKAPRKPPIGVRATSTTHTSASKEEKVSDCRTQPNHLEHASLPLYLQ